MMLLTFDKALLALGQVLPALWFEEVKVSQQQRPLHLGPGNAVHVGAEGPVPGDEVGGDEGDEYGYQKSCR